MTRRSKFGSVYAADWPGIAMRCKDAAGWKCERCGHAHDPATGFTLTVHHLDLDPGNNRWWNLAALDQRCHLHIQAKVIMARPWLYEHSAWMKPHVAGYYAWLRGRPDDRESVLARLEELLAEGPP